MNSSANDVNAYRPDDPLPTEGDDLIRRYQGMSIVKAPRVAGSALVFAIGGAALGSGSGAFAPGYYRAILRQGDEPWFEPVSVGPGLGLTQGAVVGVLVGIALVAILAWRRT